MALASSQASKEGLALCTSGLGVPVGTKTIALPLLPAQARPMVFEERGAKLSGLDSQLCHGPAVGLHVRLCLCASVPPSSKWE